MLDIDQLLKSGDLYQTEFEDGTKVLYRLLTLKEYRIFRALRDASALHPWEIGSLVWDRCRVGPELALTVRAGVEISVGEFIMWLSGDCDAVTIKEDIEALRASYPIKAVSEFMKRVICIAFPSYKWEDLDELTRPDLLQRFIVAEAVLMNKSPDYKPLDLKSLVGPGEADKKPKINFKQENRAIRRAMAGDTERDEQVSGLSMAQIAKLKQAK